MTEFVNTVNIILVWYNASLAGCAVPANVHRRANLTVVKTTTSVD
jgi:hypothetical protein